MSWLVNALLSGMASGIVAGSAAHELPGHEKQAKASAEKVVDISKVKPTGPGITIETKIWNPPMPPVPTLPNGKPGAQVGP